MAIINLVARVGEIEFGNSSRFRRTNDAVSGTDDTTLLAIDTDIATVTTALDLRINGTSVFSAALDGVLEFPGSLVSMSLSQTPNPHSGTIGLHLNRSAATLFAHGLSLDLDNVPVWEGMGIDFATTDLVFAYSHALQADVFRMRNDTAQVVLGPTVGTPPLNGPQFGINGGSLTNPKGCLSLTQFGSSDYTIQLLTGVTNNQRTKIVFGGQGATGFQMGTDSGNNNTNDFWIANNATGQFDVLIDASDVVKLGNSGNANSAVQLRSQKHGFFNATPVTRPTITGSRGSNAALTSLCSALATLGLVVDSTS